MAHNAFEHVRNSFDAAMRAHGKAQNIVVRVTGAKMVKQQKRIHVIQHARRHTSVESYACTFEDSLRRHNL
jgi:hypothetical protein